LWRQESQANIPIEVIEVSQKKKSPAKPIAKVKSVPDQPKPVTPKPLAITQKLQTANLSTQVVPRDKLTAKPVGITPDENKISIAKNIKAIAEQRQRQLAEQRQRQLAEQQQRQLAEQQQRQLAEQQQRQLAEQRQRQLAEQQQRQLAEQRQRQLAEEQQRQLAEQQQRQLAEQRQRQLAEQRQRQLAEQQQPENTVNTNKSEPFSPPPNATGGSLMATIVGEPEQGQRDRHTNQAKIKPSNQPFTKGLEYTKFIEQKPGEPVELTVILTISEKGKLEKVAIADPVMSPEQKSQYEDFLTNQVFNGWEFEPAYDIDPQDPKPSNLTVRIKIQPQP
jgi:colicin import membrane protein